MAEKKRIRINVSGLCFETYEHTLQRFPDTLLGCESTRAYFYDKSKDELFFDRNRVAFDAVLFYYQSYGILRRPNTVSESTFKQELEFFKIQDNKTIEVSFQTAQNFLLDVNLPLPKHRVRKKIWILFSRPDSSLCAKLIEITSTLLLMVTIAISCVKTLPVVKRKIDREDNITSNNYFWIEHFCYAWFTFEFFVRLVTVSDKRMFFSSFSSVIDLCTIVPFYTKTLINSRFPYMQDSVFARGLKFLGMVRLIRTVRSSRGMRALFYTAHISWRDLQLYSIIVLLLNVLVASIAFFFEDGHEGNLLISIPEAMWWSLNTFTTVGYGDYYPITIPGKVIGGFCSVAGIIFLGLPVYSFVSNFLKLWESFKLSGQDQHMTSGPRVSVKKLKELWMLESKKIRRSLRRR